MTGYPYRPLDGAVLVDVDLAIMMSEQLDLVHNSMSGYLYALGFRTERTYYRWPGVHDYSPKDIVAVQERALDRPRASDAHESHCICQWATLVDLEDHPDWFTN